MDSMLKNPQAQRGVPAAAVIDLITLLHDCDDAEIAVRNIRAMLDLIIDGHDRITDVRRLSIFCRFLRSAEHELTAATRPRSGSPS